MNFLRNIFSKRPSTDGFEGLIAESKTSVKRPYIHLESNELVDGIFRPKLITSETVKLDAIARKLDALKGLMEQNELDGVTVDQVGLFPSTPDEVDAFETQHNVSLPEDFKTLLNKVGYNIFPYHSLTPSVDSMELPLGDGSDKIPHQPNWYINANKKVIEVSDYGCGIYFILCLFKPEHGNIWILDAANTGTAAPIIPENKGLKRVRFIDWYNYWLDAALASIDRDLS